MEHHHHSHELVHLGRAFTIGVAINFIFVIVETAAGLVFNSVGLLSDAGHNLTDVTSLLLAMLAFRLSKLPSDKTYTYGYKKSTILISLINGILLGVAVFWIVYESIDKFIHPQDMQGLGVAGTAALGIIVNGVTASLFVKDKKHDLNVKGAYLHMLMDALVSLGVVVSGVLIYFTGWTVIDPIIGLVVAVIIAVSTWNLLMESFRLVMDGIPTSINPDDVREKIIAEEFVCDVHHVHIWAISTTENALTAHIVVEDLSRIGEIKHRIKHLLEDLEIGHSTLEFELKDEECCGHC